jgi:iron complex outermembrane recepter protein
MTIRPIGGKTGSALLGALIAAYGANPASAQASTYKLNLPAEPLAKALQDLAQVTHQKIAFSADQAAGKQTVPLQGTFDAATALGRLLAASNLTAESTGDGTWVVKAAADPGPQANSEVATPEDRLAEIIVTAQHQKENIQKVPIDVSAFSGPQLADSGIQSTQDLATLVPGLDYTAGLGIGTPYLRGVGSTANGVGAENEVALYVDDVYQGSKSAATDQLLDIAQVEVLKGPQGTLFGRNATGGAIQVNTLDPKQEWSATVKVGYGNYDTILSDLYVTGGITPTLALSLSGFVSNQNEGWGRNSTTGAQVNLTKEGGTRAKLLWTPDDSTRVTLSGDYSTMLTSVGDAYRPLYNILPAHGGLYTGGQYDVNSNDNPESSTIVRGVSLKIERQWHGLELTSITAARKTNFDVLVDEDAGPVDYLSDEVSVPEHQVSQEFRVAGGTSYGLKWQGGAFLYFAGGTEVADIFGEELKTVANEFLSGTQNTRSYAGYGQGTQDLGADTRVTLGVRYTYEERRLIQHISEDYTTGEVVDLAQADKSTSFSAPTWRIAFDHDFTPDILGYLSYNRGFKSGGFNPVSTTPPVRPETIDAYEIGLKSQWLDHRLRLNAAAFDYDWRDMQLQTNINGVSYLANAASAKLYGLDADAELQVTSGLRLLAGLESMKSYFSAFPGALGAVQLITGGNATPVIDATGHDLPYAPRFSGDVSAVYTCLVAGGAADFNVTARYNAGYYPEVNNLLRQSAFTVVNSTLSWTTPDDRYTVSLWARNLTNQFYTTALTAQSAGSVLSAAPPRTYGLSLQGRF